MEMGTSFLNPFREDGNLPYRGTTLITVATEDGIVMAADDLVYAKQGGQTVPALKGIQKVFIVDSNVLIGSCGLMMHRPIKYDFKDWLSEFIQAHQTTSAAKRPSDVATALEVKMRRTFQSIESIPEDEIWKTNSPGDRFINYVVAGYAESFHRPYLFELGAEVGMNKRIRYVPSFPRTKNNVWFGEDYFFRRAQNRIEPEYSSWLSITKSLDVSGSLPTIPNPLQDLVASVASLVKVEAQFNPQKVGSKVMVGLIDRKARTSCIVPF
jgi:hypothetical protein